MSYGSSNSDPSNQQRPFSPDDALPPVEAPSAGFILQLFVVPGVIVVIIVLVWLMFNWLAQRGNDPKAYVRAIKGNNEARWQAAVNLANTLNNEKGAGYQDLRRDHEMVKDLADILTAEIDAGSMEEKPVMFRYFLCRALGSFEVNDGLPALLKAASTQRDPKETAVRRSALEAIALLAANLRTVDPEHPLTSPELTGTLLAAAADEDALVRSEAAFAMGVIGGDELNAKLKYLLDDGYPDVRYNAATGLARHGEPAAMPVLIEMLDPNEKAGVEIEKEAASRDYKRALLEFNALRAVATLLQQDPQIDATPFVPAIKKLLDSNPPSNISLEAKNLLQTIAKGSKQAAEKP